MKKLFTLALGLLASASVYAQRDINMKAEIVSPTSTPTITPGVPADFTYVFANQGSETITPNDSIFYQDAGFSSQGQVRILFNRTVAPGDTVMVSHSWTFTNAPDGPFNWCVTVAAVNRSNAFNETDTTDNTNCLNVIFSGFDPNGIGDVLKVDTRITNKLDIVPNPTSSVINFDFVSINNSDVRLTITDITGKIVASQNLGQPQNGNNKYSFDASQLVNGLYFVEIAQEGNRSVGKFNKL